MTTSITSFNTGITVSGNISNDSDLVGTTKQSINKSVEQSYADGSGDAQIQIVYAAKLTLASGVPVDLNLSDGSLKDDFGNALVFTKVKGIYIRNYSTATGEDLEVGGDANALIGWVKDATDIVTVPTRAKFLTESPRDGWAVVGSTGDILQVTNAGAASIDFDVIIWGLE